MYRVYLRDSNGNDIIMYETKNKPCVGEFIVTVMNDVYEIKRVALHADVGRSTGIELVTCEVIKKRNGKDTDFLKMNIRNY